jgi:HKD family nuclease
MTLFPDSNAVVIGLPPNFDICKELVSARTIRLATAFAHKSGWVMLSDSISRSPATKYLFTGPSFFQTEPYVLSAWLNLCKQGKAHAAMYSGGVMTFHPKVLIVEGSKSFAIVGSGNLSQGGLRDNVECGVYIKDSATVGELWFDELFRDATPLTDEGVVDYKRKWDKLQAAAKKLRIEQAEAENEFVEKNKATLKNWNTAVAIAKRYFASPDFSRSYDGLVQASRLIETALDYPNFRFDAAGWKSFYAVWALGHLIPIYRDSIFKEKRRLQSGLRKLVSEDTRSGLHDLLASNGRYHIPRFGLNAISKILAVHAPKKWTVYNGPVEKVLRSFGYVPPRGGTTADKYFAFTDMMDRFKKETGAEDAYALDAFFLHYSLFLKGLA